MSILSSLRPPATWQRVPFGRVAERSKESGRPDLPPLSVFLGAGVVPRESREDNHNQLGEDLGKYLVVRPGDLVFNKLRTWQGGLGASRHEGIVSPAYFVCRPRVDYDSRFLQYLLLSDVYLQELTRVSKWQPPSQFDIGWEQLSAVPIVAPPRPAQRAIADYLDAETALIDALIAKKQRMIELIENRRLAAIETALGGGRTAASFILGDEQSAQESVPLKRLLIRTIAGGTPDSNDSSFWTDEAEGTAWVAIGDMLDSSTTTETVRRLTPAGLAAVRLRPAPAGTLLFAMYASLGKLTVSGMPCVWNQAILGLVPDDTKVDSEYLALWLEVLRQHFGVLARSTTQDNLNAEQVGALPIPNRPLEDQLRVVRQLRPSLTSISSSTSLLVSQIDLLRERRQALITAAVTGELEVPGVAA